MAETNYRASARVAGSPPTWQLHIDKTEHSPFRKRMRAAGCTAY